MGTVHDSPRSIFGIVTDVQAAGLPFYFGVAADEGMGKHNIVGVSKGAGNGVFDNRIIDAGLFADGDVGSYDGITDVAARSNADGLKDDGILELVLRGDGAAEFLEQFGIGLQQGLFFAAIEPILHLEGAKFYAAADHAFDGVGEVVLAIAGHVVADIGFQAIEKNIHLPACE